MICSLYLTDIFYCAQLHKKSDRQQREIAYLSEHIERFLLLEKALLFKNEMLEKQLSLLLRKRELQKTSAKRIRSVESPIKSVKLSIA